MCEIRFFEVLSHLTCYNPQIMTKNGCEFIEFFLHVTDHLIIVRVIIMINHKFFLNI